MMLILPKDAMRLLPATAIHGSSRQASCGSWNGTGDQVGASASRGTPASMAAIMTVSVCADDRPPSARRRDPAPAVTILTPGALRLQRETQADCARYDSLRRTS
ncbi:hypothetical protein NKJ48_31185 [Mesorhizobium sp. M0114]|uniref:hypothetical protein n=1 Tax=Mesorhizobium sp. M0114 TaxID=2956882 RepID=UPI003338B20E